MNPRRVGMSCAFMQREYSRASKILRLTSPIHPCFHTEDLNINVNAQHDTVLGQLGCIVFLRVPSGRYHVQDPSKYAQVKRAALLVMSTPVAPVKSRGHLGLVQPGVGVGVVEVEVEVLLSIVLVVEGTVVLGSVVEEAVLEIVLETVLETVELGAVDESVLDTVVDVLGMDEVAVDDTVDVRVVDVLTTGYWSMASW
jgi:hypothetical protein